ncbi:hypothetical protein SAMN05660653_00937 [Desulfonatronum thiosulfatophilum]|uniref:Negative regulator of RcsB-dependent stress response n=1 Tax=Desulfonatronum thiosulfatophilum TaxID=617002 RepID=A0A1G6BE27_9BACT|nr:tetratricopeptide repeat protein [Desulfonatronum thiosulfatophilum]SDB18789.1 hypothetical protein SAMN05660653_00937 [Desulfonatronum thiosulfatophilum]
MSPKSTKDQKPLPEQGKAPDKGLTEQFEAEIGTPSRQFFHVLVNHWQWIAAGVGVLVLLISGTAGYGAYQERRVAKSEEALDQVLLETQGAERLNALLEIEGRLAKPLLPRHHLETARTAQNVQNWATALEYWNQLAALTPGNWVTTARLGQATALLHLGQADEAVTELQSLRDSASEEFMPIVLWQLAEAAEAAGHWDTALDTYDELKTRGSLQHADFLEFRKARIRQQAAQDRS